MSVLLVLHYSRTYITKSPIQRLIVILINWLIADHPYFSTQHNKLVVVDHDSLTDSSDTSDRQSLPSQTPMIQKQDLLPLTKYTRQ